MNIMIVLTIINVVLCAFSLMVFFHNTHIIVELKSVFKTLHNHKTEIELLIKKVDGLDKKWQWIRDMYK